MRNPEEEIRLYDERQEILKPAHLWAPDEVHALVIDSVGSDDDFPRGYQVLIKLYSPSDLDSLGMQRTDREVQDTIRSTMVGQVLRMGCDAFMDKVRFPMGPSVTFGEWAVFRGSERQRIRRNGVDMAYINDDRFLGVTKDPSNLETVFDMIHEFTGS